ncbi:hypothetical protein Clacol_000568 [Clathrus columnatus]|uniref:Uncharacterized protein n=1 Tax=Clathrus columnatus TaxID=1419009 RepID=A0AAV4ZWV8_9AGAM|nr:hypothetical protein Clacol_000568 [Clathrus columnatus]
MANKGLGDATTTTQNSKQSGSTILIVILVVVLSILAMCVSGIAVIVYWRRRARKYIRIPQHSEDGTAVEASTSNSRPDAPWSSFLRCINIFNQSSSPSPYQPIQLPDNRPPGKVGNRLGDPNIPRSPPITDTSSSAPPQAKVPTPRPNPTPSSTPHTPHRSLTVPAFFRVYQEVKRIAPLPESTITRPAPPVRAPTTPVNLPSRNLSPPLLGPMAVLNIAPPPGFTIDGTPSPSLVGTTGTNNQRRLNGLRYDRNHTEDDVGNNPESSRPIPWYPGSPRSTRTTVTTQDSDSVIDQPWTLNKKRKKSVDEPMSPASLISPRTDDSATTSGSIAGSSRPPTLTIKNVLNFVTRKPVLPSLNLLESISFSSQPDSHPRAPSQIAHGRQPIAHSQSPPHRPLQLNNSRSRQQQSQRAPQYPTRTRTPPARTLQEIPQSQSPPNNRSKFNESHQNYQHRPHPPQRSPEPVRRALPTPHAGDGAQASQLDHNNRETEIRRNNTPDNHTQSSLFPSAVVSAGYHIKSGPVPNPLPLGDARSRVYDSTVVPPPTPYSWAFLRTNRI